MAAANYLEAVKTSQSHKNNSKFRGILIHANKIAK